MQKSAKFLKNLKQSDIIIAVVVVVGEFGYTIDLALYRKFIRRKCSEDAQRY
jgi:hypothetical protein